MSVCAKHIPTTYTDMLRCVSCFQTIYWNIEWQIWLTQDEIMARYKSNTDLWLEEL